MTFGYDEAVIHRANDNTHDVSKQHNLCGPVMSATQPVSIDPAAVLQRMRQVTGTTTDAGLAAAVELTQAAVSNWRQRNVVPYQACAHLAETRGVSLDWLIFGRSPVALSSAGVDDSQPARAASEQAARITRFVLFFDANHSAEDVVWLEQHMKRSVPEYAVWLTEGE